MVLSNNQKKFVQKLVSITENESQSDMAGYIYLYRNKLKAILLANYYTELDKEVLNTLGKYYKKLILHETNRTS